MVYVRATIRNVEVMRHDQPELWVNDTKVLPGEEVTVEVHVDERGPEVVAKLNEEMAERAKLIKVADEKVTRDRKEEAANPKKEATPPSPPIDSRDVKNQPPRPSPR